MSDKKSQLTRKECLRQAFVEKGGMIIPFGIFTLLLREYLPTGFAFLEMDYLDVSNLDEPIYSHREVWKMNRGMHAFICAYTCALLFINMMIYYFKLRKQAKALAE